MEEKSCWMCNGKGAIKKGLFRKDEYPCQLCGGTGSTDIPNHFKRLGKIRPRLFKMKTSGNDISKIMEHLSEAKRAIKNNEHQRAKEIIDEVENEFNRLGF